MSVVLSQKSYVQVLEASLLFCLGVWNNRTASVV
jgi:hypothetical protein